MPKFRVRMGSNLPSVLEYGELFLKNGVLYAGEGEGIAPIAVSGGSSMVGGDLPDLSTYALKTYVDTETSRAEGVEASLTSSLSAEVTRARAAEASLLASIGSGSNTPGAVTIATENKHFIGAAGEPQFQNGWSNCGSPWKNAAFYKDPFGIVHLEGFISNGTGSSIAFTLPSGYTPAEETAFADMGATGGTTECTGVRISSNGNVQVDSTSNGFQSLDGITFQVDNTPVTLVPANITKSKVKVKNVAGQNISGSWTVNELQYGSPSTDLNNEFSNNVFTSKVKQTVIVTASCQMSVNTSANFYINVNGTPVVANGLGGDSWNSFHISSAIDLNIGDTLSVSIQPDNAGVTLNTAGYGMLTIDSLTIVSSPESAPTLEDRHYIGTAGEPAFQNGFVNWGAPYGNAAYYKDAQGFVHLEGLIKGGPDVDDQLIFTLPSGYTPSQQKLIPVLGRIGGSPTHTPVYITVGVDGEVKSEGGANSGFLSLDNISFRL